ncbi:hypothetical protein PS1_005626 [Malus domestica]
MDRQTCKNAQPFLISERALPTKPFEIFSFLSPPIIPLQTSYTRARISHIIRVKSKSIPYHAFSLSFPWTLFLPARQGEREQSVSTWNQASSQELTAWNPLPDYLPDIALEYSSSTSYASREDTASA